MQPIAPGGLVPPFTLKDVSGVPFALAEAVQAHRPVLLSFWSSRCPCSAACEAELSSLAHDFAGRAEVFAVASDAEDTPAVVSRAVRVKRLSFRVLLDPEARVADLLGAEATPTSVVLDGSGTLRFRGDLERVETRAGDREVGGIVLREVAPGDSTAPPEPVKYARLALTDVLAGRPVGTPTTPSGGCRLTRATSR